MGLFSKTEPVVVEGTIARIGIVHHNESYITYGMHLLGRKERFWIASGVNANSNEADDDHVAMAARGDRVRFGTDPKRPNLVIGFFVNETMKVDLGG